MSDRPTGVEARVCEDIAARRAARSDLFSDLFRADAEIRKTRYHLLIANRLKDRGLWKPENDGELRELRTKLTSALLERSKLDDRISALNSPALPPQVGSGESSKP